MNSKISDPEIQNYISANLTADLHSLLLKKSPFPEISMQEIVQQIKGRQVAQKKFHFLYREGIVFPPQLNLEQSSSEKTAAYKSGFLKGEKLIDLTGGFGIDAYYLSQNFSEIIFVEQNSELLEIVQHNWKILDRKAEFINTDLETFLSKTNHTADVIYLDPARRDAQKKKVFLLEDLSPNILQLQDHWLSAAKNVVIKLSPLIDLKYLVSVLKNIFRIEIIAVKNDVKEVVIIISEQKNDTIICKCVNLESNEDAFTYHFGDEENAEAEFGEPEKYIYIPNNAVLKAGVFNLTAEKFHLKKLHPNTHIYTSGKKIKDFPGRVLEMQQIDSKQIKKNEQYNIISKNYPLKPEEIKKKYHLKDGGESYLIFTQSKKGKIILKSL